jgi:hypothetical protein
VPCDVGETPGAALVRPPRDGFSFAGRFCASVPFLGVLFLYWVSCAAEVRSNYSAPNYTLKMAVSNAISLGGDVARSPFFWFLPVACTMLLGYVVWPERSVRRLCEIGSIGLPAVFVGPSIVLLPLLALAVPAAVYGLRDGEAWGEGWVMFGTMGAWMDMWGVLFVVEALWSLRSRR